MRKTTLLLGLAFAATTLTGCDDDVTKVCKKMAELAEKDKDLPEEAKKELKDLEKCKAEGAKEKEKDPEGFKKMSDCVMGASDMGGVMKCAMEEAAAGGDKDKKEEEKK
jgi:hypothetical protein